MGNLFQELRRRNVFRVAAAYLVVSWLIIQVVASIVPIIGAPDWVEKSILVFIVAGFPLAVLFAWAFELTPDGVKRTVEVDPGKSVTPETGRKLNYMIIGGLVAVIAMMGIERLYFAGMTGDEASGAAAAADRSIAVLPFEDFSPDKDQDYFSSGISEEILNLLAKTEQLKVAARTSSFAFKGQNEDIRDIGRKLEVGHVLEGSVRKAGTKIRVTAQLIQVEDGYHMWSETYDRELVDVFAIQDEISAAILEALKFHLLGEATVGKALRTGNMDAYNAYLIGKDRLGLRTKEDIEAAIEKFEEAMALDPAFAPPYAQAAHAWLLLDEDNFGDLDKKAVDARVQPLLDKALELASDMPEAIAISGLHHMERFRYDEARLAFDRAIALNPNYALAYVWRSRTFKQQSRYLDMLADNERAYALDPMSLEISASLASDYRKFWRPEDADRIARRMADLHPGHPQAYRTAIANLATVGRYGEATLLLEEAVAALPDNEYLRDWLAWSYAYLGFKDKALAIGAEGLKADLAFQEGRYDETLELLREAQAENPEDVWPWDREMHVFYAMGDMARLSTAIDVYIDKMEAAGQPWRDWCDMDHILFMRKAGKTDGVDSMMEQCRQRTVGALEAKYICPCSWFALVSFAVLEGRLEDAARRADEWLNNGDSNYDLEIDPVFSELKDHPRYAEFLRRNAEQRARQRQIYLAGKKAGTGAP